MPVRPVAPPPSPPPSAPVTARALAARAWLEALDLDSSAAQRLAVARTKAPTTGPAGVQRAFALYATWQARDLGSVRLLKSEVEGREVFALHTTTDGDDSFVELFDARGALVASGVRGADGAIAWDDVPGAVRDRVASYEDAPSVRGFFDEILAGEHAASTAADKLAVDELRRAAAHLIGTDLSLRSVDGGESAALFRVLADDHTLTPSARAYALRLGALYVDAPKELKKVKDRPLSEVTETDTSFASSATLASADVKGRKDAPRLLAFSALLRATHDLIPTQLAPATKSAATAALREAGATATEARKAIDELKVGGAELFVGRAFSYDASSSASVPKDEGLLVLSATPDGKRVRAIVVPQEGAAPSADAPREAITALTGVDREIAVVAPTSAGAFSLEWRPPSGGALSVELDLSDPAAPRVSAFRAAPVLEEALRASLAERLRTALGHDVDVLGWVGRDDASGPGFIVAHKQPGTLWPVSLHTVRIALGGASATVTAKAIGTSAADRTLSQDLALHLARAHAARMVEDPAMEDGARLEVALRTRWASTADLEELDASSSPVGFDPSTDRVQWMLPRVWGDNAVVITFANDGSMRVEDVN